MPRRRYDSVTVEQVNDDGQLEIVTKQVYAGKAAEEIIAFIEDKNLKPQSEQKD